MELDKQIEAILFFKGEPIKKKALEKMLEVSNEEIDTAITTLKESLSNRGIVLMQKDDSVSLGTAPEMGELIESVRKNELSKDLGKAGLETLSIILYKGPIARSEIDWIRGVNSSFIIRNLMIRGLIERVTNKQDSRSFLYRPTFELLSFLGVRSIEELPEYEKVAHELETFLEEQEKEEGEVSEMDTSADAFAEIEEDEPAETDIEEKT